MNADAPTGELPAEAVADEGLQGPTDILREAVENRIARVEEELVLIERQHRQLGTRIEECREKREAAENIRTLLLRNLAKYGPADVSGAMDDLSTAVSQLALSEQRFEELGDRRQEARDRLKALHADLELVMEAVREAPLPEGPEIVNYRKASRQVFQVIEEERMRIARDMHDGPAQSMSNLVLQAEILERLVGRDPEQMLAELQDFKNSVRNALEETRQLIFDLRPMTLDDLGLVPTLRKYIKEYGDKFGFATRFNVVGEERRLPGNTEGTLFRIIQEALTNVQKHAQARTAEVTLNLGKDKITALVKDDGIGFSPETVDTDKARNRHLGLISMRERTELERGTLDIRSEPGKGTEVRIEVRP